MGAQAVSQSNARFNGIRPFNPSKDMGGVALLLEEAFKEDAGFLHVWSRVPVLRELGAQLWAASFAPASPDSLTGFVWEEGRRIIGNVTLTPDESRRRHWMISNVAVEESYRRRGIARELMLAAIEEAVRRSATWLVLNVRPQNAGAIRLYDQLGFQTVDTEMGYVRRRSARSAAEPLAARPLKRDEYYAALELARAGMSERLRQFRPLRPSEFALHIEDRAAERIGDFLLRQSTERWAIADGEELRATAVLRGQHIGSPHSFDIRVHPGWRGELEPGLLAFVLARLARFPQRDIGTRVLESHARLVQALGDEGFVPTRGLTLMAKPLGGNSTGGAHGHE